MLLYRPAFYCDICIVSLKYFFIYGTLNLTFYITLHYIQALAAKLISVGAAHGKVDVRQVSVKSSSVFF